MRHDCPWTEWPDAWIETPEAWFGYHASARAEAMEKAREKGIYGLLLDFAGYMAMLENWNLPGFSGNPAKNDIGQTPLAIIVWVVSVIKPEYEACFQIPKVSLNPSLEQEGEKEKTPLTTELPAMS